MNRLLFDWIEKTNNTNIRYKDIYFTSFLLQLTIAIEKFSSINNDGLYGKYVVQEFLEMFTQYYY